MSAGGGRDQLADAAALVALLDFVPPAIGLVADHGRLFLKDMQFGKQVEKGSVGARHRTEEFPSREDGDASGYQGAA